MGEQVNINTADVERLSTLPGISEKLATRIIEYREEKGAFASINGLAAVPGISQRMVSNMEGGITVADESTAVAEPARAADNEEAQTDATSSELSAEAEKDDIQESEAAAPAEEASEAETEPASKTTVESDGETDDAAEPEEEILAPGTTPIIVATRPEKDKELVGETGSRDKESEPVTAVSSTASTPTKQRSSMVGSIIAAVFGAILGTALTLSILFGFNETLQFASSSQANELQRQLETELETLQSDRDQLQRDVDTLTAEMTEVTSSQAMISGTAVALQADLDSVQARADELQSKAAELNDRLQNVAQSAEDFETFLIGLRELIFQVAGTPEPTATSAPESVGPSTPRIIIMPTESPTATPEQAATRTPRPTATQIGLPTQTPTVAPQP